MYALMRWPSGEAGASAAVTEGIQTLQKQGVCVCDAPMVSTLWNLRIDDKGTTYGEGWYPIK